MSLNQIGGITGVAVFAAILYLHGCKHEPIREERPVAPVVQHVAPAPAPVAKPAAPPVRQFPEVVPCIGDFKCGTRSEKETKPVSVRPNAAILKRPKPVYHRVLKGGEIDGPMDCKKVPQIAKEYPPDVVLKYAKKMGMAPEELAKLRVCLN